MRKGVNVKYCLDQRELVRFIRDVKQLKHVTDEQIGKYCADFGSLATYCGKTEYYYDPASAVYTLWREHGMLCPICDSHYTTRNSIEERTRYALRVCFLPELPNYRIHYNEFMPVMCQACYISYKKYINKSYIKAEIHSFDDEMKLPIKFLGVVANRIGKGISVNGRF